MPSGMRIISMQAKSQASRAIWESSMLQPLSKRMPVMAATIPGRSGPLAVSNA